MDMFEPEISSRHRLIAKILFIAVALGAFITTFVSCSLVSNLPRTTDASVSAEVVHIAAGLPGRISLLAIHENDEVKEGQLLFKLEDTSYRLLRDQASAGHEVALAALDDAIRLSKASEENAETATFEIARAKTNLELAIATVTRLEPLAAEGITSQQTLDTARTAVSDAGVSLKVAQQTAQAAKYLITSTDALQSQVRVAEAALALAQYNLSLTEVRAPFDGKITGLEVTEGTWVLPEAPIFTLIDSSSWYVVGLFRETELSAFSRGQPVRVRVQSNPDVVLKGRVESIAWGVLSTDEITINGILPYVATSANWVQLAKRFPVRVSIENPSVDWLRMGASATLVLQSVDSQHDANE